MKVCRGVIVAVLLLVITAGFSAAFLRTTGNFQGEMQTEQEISEEAAAVPEIQEMSEEAAAVPGTWEMSEEAAAVPEAQEMSEEAAAVPETQEIPVESRQNVLRYVNYYPVDFDGLDPVNLKRNTESVIVYHVMEGLMRIYKYRLQYGMADSYEISLDECTYTFHIREDACYSDGRPVTAADFQRAFFRVMEEQPESEYIGGIKYAKEIRDGDVPPDKLAVTALDEHTLQIELAYRDAQFLRYLAYPEFSPVREDAQGTLRGEDCNGPFYLAVTEDDTFCRMEKNPYYWDVDRIRLDAAEAVCIPDINDAYGAFAKGELNIIPLPTAESDYAGAGFFQKVQTGTSDDIYLDLETEGPLQCRELRLALNYALDREAYCAAVDNALIEPNVRYVPNIGEGECRRYMEANPDSLIPVKGDAKLAEEYLQKALELLKLTSADEIRLPFAVHDDFWSRKEGMTVAAQWEEKLGIHIDFVYVNDQELNEYQGTGGMLLVGSGVDYADPAQYLGFWDYEYAPADPENNIRFREFLNQAKNQTDEQIRFNTLYEAEKKLTQDSPMIPLQLRSEMLLLDPRLTGFETSVDFSGGQYEFLYAEFS